METHKKIEQLETRADRTQYTGQYSDFQTFGSSYFGKRYSTSYEKDPYSEYQNFLYKRALFGTKMYTQEELLKMHPDKKKRIEKVSSRTQNVLNIWKQKRIIEITNVIFSIFKKGTIASEIIDNYSDTNPMFMSKSSLKELGINKEMVIDKLLEEKILPQNFKELR